jgi:transcriptional regulator with XRE-family HTH domain
MQAFPVILEDDPYNGAMPSGRPPKHKRSAFGERLYTARVAAGLSQAQVAEQMGVTQPSYADWERRMVALRPDHLPKLAAILRVTVEQLLGAEPSSKRGAGPVGKARQVFERVSQLPRATQQRILANVEDSLTAYEARKAS